MNKVDLDSRSKIDDNLDIKLANLDGNVEYSYIVSAEWQNSKKLILSFTDLEIFGGEREKLTISFVDNKWKTEDGCSLIISSLWTHPYKNYIAPWIVDVLG